MGPPGHSASLRMGRQGAKATPEIDEKPQSQKDHGRQLNGLEENKNRHQRDHSGMGEEQQIGPHNSSDSATRTHCGRLGGGIEDNVQRPSSQTTEQIKA